MRWIEKSPNYYLNYCNLHPNTRTHHYLSAIGWRWMGWPPGRLLWYLTHSEPLLIKEKKNQDWIWILKKQRDDMAQPSLQIVFLSPSPSTPIISSPHWGSHCLKSGYCRWDIASESWDTKIQRKIRKNDILTIFLSYFRSKNNMKASLQTILTN